MTFTVIICEFCGHKTKPLTDKEVKDLGVPWYCDCCGKRANRFKRGTLEEVVDK